MRVAGERPEKRFSRPGGRRTTSNEAGVGEPAREHSQLTTSFGTRPQDVDALLAGLRG